MADVRAFAPAKINLTLHVTGRRSDGYHMLDSLVVFADIGDEITATPAKDLSLSVTGPCAAGVPQDSSNLVLRAAELLRAGAPLGATLTLNKFLPAASGIGGGSSDAAASLRALAELWGLPVPGRTEVLPLGADLPVCMQPAPQRMSGIGDVLSDLLQVPPLHIVLINPRIHVPTPQVFKALAQPDNPAMAAQLPAWAGAAEFVSWLAQQRNDLEAPAIATAAPIAACLAALRAHSECQLARMSGSGATCFGIYPSAQAAEEAAQTHRAQHPGWWVAAGTTGGSV
ncbi:4-(cytidine 5'-diphospho)-2-C-methyl-D-erythritol kinase [Cognatishimia sp. SS12]|uniref:4-(cytidine 5'-diphospho)-2-C-methyl-D-erythritol kinase n=1 Tax=Cognatishimia sp. SS12 TaxID=2979465 RepID=UPI003FA47216